jgi:hypothetical protein
VATVPYTLLFYNPPPTRIPAAQREKVIADTMQEMRDWQAEMQRAGVFRGGTRLAPPDAATSVRQQDGKVLVTDGPFAETKEFLAGLVTLECADLDEALSWARRCPIVRFGTVEVRPEHGGPRA